MNLAGPQMIRINYRYLELHKLYLYIILLSGADTGFFQGVGRIEKKSIWGIQREAFSAPLWKNVMRTRARFKNRYPVLRWFLCISNVFLDYFGNYSTIQWPLPLRAPEGAIPPPLGSIPDYLQHFIKYKWRSPGCWAQSYSDHVNSKP